MSSSRSLQGTKPSKEPWATFRITTLILLPLLSVLGGFGTMVLSSENGTFDAITDGLKSKSPVFPGTTDALVWKYSGVEVLDNQMRILVSFFAPVVDTVNPELNLFSLFGLGQFGAAWTLLMMESMRMGNKGRIVSFIGTFGILIQNISFTITLPLYLFLHLLTSPVGKSFSSSESANAIIVSTLDMALIPVAIGYGYLIPSMLMGLPASIVPSLARQRLIAFWQLFPLWTVIIQHILRGALKNNSEADTRATSKKDRELYMTSAQGVYGFAITLSAVCYLPVILATLLPASILPANTPAYIVKLFGCSFSNVFVPYYPAFSTKVDLAGGVLNFLQWDMYVGGTAFLLWGMLLCRTSVDGSVQWTKAAWTLLSWIIVSGPMGALAMLLWERDTILKEKVKEG